MKQFKSLLLLAGPGLAFPAQVTPAPHLMAARADPGCTTTITKPGSCVIDTETSHLCGTTQRVTAVDCGSCDSLSVVTMPVACPPVLPWTTVYATTPKEIWRTVCAKDQVPTPTLIATTQVTGVSVLPCKDCIPYPSPVPLPESKRKARRQDDVVDWDLLSPCTTTIQVVPEAAAASEDGKTYLTLYQGATMTTSAVDCGGCGELAVESALVGPNGGAQLSYDGTTTVDVVTFTEYVCM